MDLLDFVLGDDDPYLTKTQAPVQRPAPIQRPEAIPRPGDGPVARPRAPAPMAAPPQQVAPMAPQQAAPQAQDEPPPSRMQFMPPGAKMTMPEPSKDGFKPFSDRDLDDLIFGDGAPKKSAARPGPVTVPFPGYKDPKDEGWMEWMANNVAGRSDPKFKDAPGISQVLQDEIFKGDSDAARSSYRNIVAGHTLTPDSEAQTNIVKNALGDRFIKLEKDAYGADVVHYRAPSGLPAVAYVNRPGLDMEDVNTTALQTLPYLAMGRLVGGLGGSPGGLGQVLGQGTGAASTSILGDLGAMYFGSEKAPDPVRAGLVGMFGAGAEGLSPIVGNLYRKFVTEPSLYNKATGQLTEKGMEAARKAGFDPADLSGEMIQKFAEEFAKVRQPMIAGQTVRTKEFDLPVTRGQMTKDPDYLLTEKAMRYGAMGDAAKTKMQDFDRRQAQAITESAIGSGPKSVAARLNPDRAAATTRLSDTGSGIQDGMSAARDVAKTELKDAWGKVGPQYATPEALDLLPGKINSALDGMVSMLEGVTPGATPAAPVARTMVEMLRKFRAGDATRTADEFLGGATVPELDSIRRTLGQMSRSAQGADREAAGRVYRGFNDWLEEAGNKALIAGDAAAYKEAVKARDLTVKFKEAFTAETLQGPATPGRKIVAKILDSADNPESVVKALFGSDPGAVPKQGSQEAIRLIKQGIKNLPDDQAASVVNDLKLAHWMNVTTNSAGQVHTPLMIAQRIEKAMHSQMSLMREVYKPEDIALMRRFGAAMRDLAYKDPNPSGTGTANLVYANKWGQALVRMLGNYTGPLAKVMQMTMEVLPVKNAAGSVAASAATSPKALTVNPRLGPLGAATYQQARE